MEVVWELPSRNIVDPVPIVRGEVLYARLEL